MGKTRVSEKGINTGYAAVHAFYWMYYGVISSFASVFLLGRGFSNWQIGVIISIGNILSIVIQPFVADIADRSKKVSIYTVMEIITFVGIGVTAMLLVLKEKSVGLAAAFVICFGIMMILQPFCNALCFKLEEMGVHVDFGIPRSAGSFAYAIMCFILGPAIEKKGIEVLPITGIATLLVFVSIIMVLQRIAASVGKVAKVSDNKENTGEEINLIRFAKRNKMFFVVNLGALGAYFANSILNTYMAQIVMHAGGDAADLGRIFGVLSFLEMPTLILYNKIHKKFSNTAMLKVSAIGYIAWMGLSGFAVNVKMIYAAQLVQPLAYALFLPAMVHFIDETMSKEEAVKGHSLFTSTIALSNILAGFSGGIILDAAGVPVLAAVGTAIAAAGAVIIFLSVDRAQRAADKM